MVPYKTSNNNSRLTDFDDLKDFVVGNTLKSVPRAIKPRGAGDNAILGSY